MKIIGSYLEQRKAELRRQVRAVVRTMLAAERSAASALICSQLQQEPVWQRAKTVLAYAPLPDEPDVWPLIAAGLAQGKVMSLPRFVVNSDSYEAAAVENAQRDLRAGRMGIPEPASHCRRQSLFGLDLILVPGVAFGVDGWRLGRGKGYYDRLLRTVRGTTCGVAFDQQIIGSVPTAPHDIRLHCIVTPTRWLVSDRRRA